MSRYPATAVVAAALSLWASAQAPKPGPTAAEQLQLFKDNRTLLQLTVDRGLELAGAGSPLDRAEAFRRTAADVDGYLRDAARAGDAPRVVELAEYLRTVLADGLLPSLREAERSVPKDSPGYQQMVSTKDQAVGTVRGTEDAIAGAGGVTKFRSVKQVAGDLARLRGELDGVAKTK